MGCPRRRPIGLLLAVLAGGLASSAEIRVRDATWTAPPEAAARTNPLSGRAGAAAGGGRLFDERCATCHGTDGRGTSKAPDLTTAEVQAQTDGELFWKLTSGNTRSGMPTFSFLPEGQRWQLTLHLRALREK